MLDDTYPRFFGCSHIGYNMPKTSGGYECGGSKISLANFCCDAQLILVIEVVFVEVVFVEAV